MKAAECRRRRPAGESRALSVRAGEFGGGEGEGGLVGVEEPGAEVAPVALDHDR
jgi:hypothetical protein